MNGSFLGLVHPGPTVSSTPPGVVASSGSGLWSRPLFGLASLCWAIFLDLGTFALVHFWGWLFRLPVPSALWCILGLDYSLGPSLVWLHFCSGHQHFSTLWVWTSV